MTNRMDDESIEAKRVTFEADIAATFSFAIQILWFDVLLITVSYFTDCCLNINGKLISSQLIIPHGRCWNGALN